MKLPLALLVGLFTQACFCSQAMDCVSFESPTLYPHQSFSHTIQRGLSFRLHAESARDLHVGSDLQHIWHISVAPIGSDERLDYAWPVSLPLDTTRHLFIGPAFQWAAHESAAMRIRRLRFALSSGEYDKAKQAYESARRQVVAPGTFDSTELRTLGKGELTVTINDSKVIEDAIEALQIAAVSCVPKS